MNYEFSSLAGGSRCLCECWVLLQPHCVLISRYSLHVQGPLPTPGQCPENSLCSVLHCLLSVLRPASSRCLALPEPSPLTPAPEPLLLSGCPLCAAWTAPRAVGEPHRVCFPPTGSLPSVAWCPLVCVLFLFLFFGYLGGRVNLVPVTPSWLEA